MVVFELLSELLPELLPEVPEEVPEELLRPVIEKIIVSDKIKTSDIKRFFSYFIVSLLNNL